MSTPSSSASLPQGDALLAALRARGVEIRAPAATVLEALDPARFEPGVVIHPGCTVRGPRSAFGEGTHLGRAGGGWFEDVCTGRGVDLYGGYFKDAVFLDGVVVRGHAEMRGGTVLEEEAEAAHHVGYKMTIALPWVIAGSLVNFCDALLAGGTSRRDHTEIGSATALYNYTPRGDKMASLFGDVAQGVFLRSPRIFVGGQTQIVSPVRVGFGAVLAAGSGVRRDVPEGHLYAGPGPAGERLRPFEPARYGRVLHLAAATVRYVGELWALSTWYERVRLPGARGPEHRDLHAERIYGAALGQIRAGIAERRKRLSALVSRVEASAERLRRDAVAAGAGQARARLEAALEEQEALVDAGPRLLSALRGDGAALGVARDAFGPALGQAFGAHNGRRGRTDYLGFIQSLDENQVAQGQTSLQAVVAAVAADAAVPVIG